MVYQVIPLTVVAQCLVVYRLLINYILFNARLRNIFIMMETSSLPYRAEIIGHFLCVYGFWAGRNYYRTTPSRLIQRTVPCNCFLQQSLQPGLPGLLWDLVIKIFTIYMYFCPSCCENRFMMFRICNPENNLINFNKCCLNSIFNLSGFNFV